MECHPYIPRCPSMCDGYKISLTHTWVDTLHVNHTPLFLCPPCKASGGWLPATICIQSCIPFFHSKGPLRCNRVEAPGGTLPSACMKKSSMCTPMLAFPNGKFQTHTRERDIDVGKTKTKKDWVLWQRRPDFNQKTLTGLTFTEVLI